MKRWWDENYIFQILIYFLDDEDNNGNGSATEIISMFMECALIFSKKGFRRELCDAYCIDQSVEEFVLPNLG
jgi:hypothetical protein